MLRVPILENFIRAPWRTAWLLVLCALGAGSALALGVVVVYASTLAAKTHRAGVVIQYGNGKVANRCVEFSENEISGLELLERTGIELSVDASNAMGVAVCKIGRDGCAFPNQPCFCQCQGSPCVYWSYWQWKNNAWQYSNLGASNTVVRNGDIDGWVWGAGTTASAQPPPDTSFDAVCAANNPTATATQTNVPPTATTASTATPILPTATEIPTETPAPPTATELPAAIAPSTFTDAAPTSSSKPTRAPSPTAEWMPTTTEIPPTAAAPQASATPRAKFTSTRIPRTAPRAAVAQNKSANAPRAAQESAFANAQTGITPRALSVLVLVGGMVVVGIGLAVLLGGAAWYFWRRNG